MIDEAWAFSAAKRKGATAKKQDSEEELDTEDDSSDDETFELAAPSPAVAPKVWRRLGAICVCMNATPRCSLICVLFFQTAGDYIAVLLLSCLHP